MFQIQQLSLGGVLDQGIALLKAKFGLLFSIMLVTIVPLQFVGGLVRLMYAPVMTPTGVVQGNSSMFLVATLGIALISLLVFPLANAALIHAVAKTYISRPTTLGECFSHGLQRWPALVGTTILMTIIIMVGLVLLIIPGIIFALWYFLAQHVTVLENTSGGAALSRSKALMKGNMGTAFVLSLIVGVINIAASFALALIPQQHLSLLAQSLLGGVMTAFGASVFVVFYFSCRCKLENFDLMVLADAVGDEG